MMDLTISPVLASAEFIAQQSRHVRIPQPGIAKAARLLHQQMQAQHYDCKQWRQQPLHPHDGSDEFLSQWIFVVDLLNFSFWSDADDPPPAVTFRDKTYTGYWCLCACIHRALEEGIPLLDAKFLSGLDWETCCRVFRTDDGTAPIPMLRERHALLREAGKILLKEFGGSFQNCILQADHSAQRLLQQVCQYFSSFRDQHTFLGRTVYLYKRVQILIADLWACFEGAGLGRFDDIDSITMFADYRVPQALLAIGALEYSEELWAHLKNGDGHLASGEEREVEIRGCSIWAVELLRRELVGMQQQQQDGSQCNAILIDFFLWDYAKANAKQLQHLPIHKTRSVFY